jgi:tetratricopeptide (TPR) repeat protein
MGFRFYKSVSVGKGLRVGVSKTGIGLSFGAKGARYSVHSSGRTRKTIGIPGSGMSYVQYRSSKTGARSSNRPRQPVSQTATPDVLASLLKVPIFAPKQEKLYVKGVLATMGSQDFAGATHAFRECISRDPSVLSAYFLGGYAVIKLGRNEEAISWLEPLVQADTSLPDKLMTKYGLDGSVMRASIEIAVTPNVMVEVEMTTPGAVLLLAELYQERGDREKAIGLLENLVDVAPDIPAIALSLAELYYQEVLWEELASMPVRIENTDDLSAEVLRYKARAMREIGMMDGALELLKEALRARKRHPEILKAARYERALTYEGMGKKSEAKRDLQRLYAEDPSYQDVAERVLPSGSS